MTPGITFECQYFWTLPTKYFTSILMPDQLRLIWLYRYRYASVLVFFADICLLLLIDTTSSYRSISYQYPLCKQYCHNPGRSYTELSNLEWYYYRKVPLPPHVSLQFRFIQYYVNYTVQRRTLLYEITSYWIFIYKLWESIDARDKILLILPSKLSATLPFCRFDCSLPKINCD